MNSSLLQNSYRGDRNHLGQGSDVPRLVCCCSQSPSPRPGTARWSGRCGRSGIWERTAPGPTATHPPVLLLPPGPLIPLGTPPRVPQALQSLATPRTPVHQQAPWTPEPGFTLSTKEGSLCSGSHKGPHGSETPGAGSCTPAWVLPTSVTSGHSCRSDISLTVPLMEVPRRGGA